MAKLEPVAIQIIGVEDMRRLSAALEQYNAGSRGDAAQISRLEAHLTEARDELAYAYNIIKNRNMRLPDSSYKTDLLNEIANLVDRDVRREIGADHAETKQQLFAALDRVHQLEQVHDQQVVALKATRDQVETLQRESIAQQAAALEAIKMAQGKRSAVLDVREVNSPLLREVSAVMRALEANSVTIRNLQEDHLVKNVGSERLREKLTEAHERIAKQNDVINRLEADLRKEQKINAFVNDECQKIRAALGLAPLAQASEVLAAIDAVQVDASMKQHTIEGLRRSVYDLEQQIAKAAPVESDKKRADALKLRLAEANDTITKQAGIIKHLHEEYHQLQGRKQGADFDLERAKEEIAFAEAEAAKYKPLIEAVRETGSRGGALFIAAGHWVELKGWTTTAATDGAQYTRVELSGNYLSGGLKCL